MSEDQAAAKYAETLRRRRAELEPHADDHVTGQHVVSRVVLRRFGLNSETAGLQLARLDLHHPERRLKMTGPNGCGKVENFIRYASRDAEKTWGRIESKLPEALAAADAGSIMDHPDLIEVIKDVMALHVVRGKESAVIHKAAWAEVEKRSRQSLLADVEALRQIHYQRTGIYLTGTDWVDSEVDEIHAATRAKYEDGFLFRMQQERAFAKVRSFFDRMKIELLVTTQHEFLLGDVPAVTMRDDRAGVGLLGGIAIDDAHSMVMPLGRHLCAATGPKNRQGPVSSSTVEQINRIQVAAAQDELYFHPDSGLEDFARTQAAKKNVQQEAHRHSSTFTSTRC